MKITLLFPMAASLFLAPIVQSAETIKPANVNVIALPAVQKPVIDAKPVIAPKVTPTIVPGDTTRKSGEVRPAAYDEKARTVKAFTPATISPRDPALPAKGSEKVGVTKPVLPDGPMLSPLDDPRKAGAPTIEFRGMSKADLQKKAEELKDKIDSFGEMGEDQNKKLQAYQAQYSKVMEILGKLNKKLTDTSSGIVQNLK